MNLRAMAKFSLQWLLAAVMITAAFFCIDAAWIPLKAGVAQQLLENAWRRTLEGDPGSRPWPWADTRPVGVLEAPRLGVRQIVLAGASGRNLAFGPAALTSLRDNDILLSGHRDTHFGFLAELRAGDLLRLTTPQRSLDFTVRWLEVIDSTRQELVLDASVARLSLVTCYPLDAAAAGGPMRLVVTATPAAAARSAGAGR